MRRRLLVLPGIFAAVFAATYVATSATGSAISVAVLATVMVGFLWLLALDVRRKPWPSASQRSHDGAYAAAAIVALHTPAQGGADCPSGFDGGLGGGADCGGGGL